MGRFNVDIAKGSVYKIFVPTLVGVHVFKSAALIRVVNTVLNAAGISLHAAFQVAAQQVPGVVLKVILFALTGIEQGKGAPLFPIGKPRAKAMLHKTKIQMLDVAKGGLFQIVDQVRRDAQHARQRATPILFGFKQLSLFMACAQRLKICAHFKDWHAMSIALLTMIFFPVPAKTLVSGFAQFLRNGKHAGHNTAILKELVSIFLRSLGRTNVVPLQLRQARTKKSAVIKEVDNKNFVRLQNYVVVTNLVTLVTNLVLTLLRVNID